MPWVLDGVNIFFLISGWFGIRYEARGAFKIIWILLIFGAINLIALYIADPTINLFSYLVHLCLWPVSSRYWFMAVYFFLILCAPIINGGIRSLSDSRFRIMMIFFTLAKVYMCGTIINHTWSSGYTFMQGFYMYCLGCWLKRDYAWFGKLSRSYYLIIFIAASLINVFLRYAGINRELVFSYSSILQIAGAASLALWVSKMRFQSKTINFISAGALGCYLLQDGTFGHNYLYSRIHDYAISHSAFDLILLLGVLFVGFWIISLIISNITDRGFIRFWNMLSNSKIYKRLLYFRF